MLDVCIIGCGNGGSQISQEGFRENIPAVAINSSKSDLLNIDDGMTKISIGDELGAGKDRGEAKKFLKPCAPSLLQHPVLLKIIDKAKVIFITGTIDGGTGSGLVPIVTALLKTAYANTDKKFVIIPVWPAMYQGISALQNSIEFLKEINNEVLKDVPRISFDNNRFAHLPLEENIKRVNKDIIEAIKVIRGDYNNKTSYESIDEKDTLRLLSIPGEIFIAQYSNFTEIDMENTDIDAMLVKYIKDSSTQVTMERDKRVVKRGVITNLNSDMNRYFNQALPKLTEFTGDPVDRFSNYSINTDEKAPNRVIVVLAGLSFPDFRLSEIMRRIEDFKNAKKSTRSTLLDSVEIDDTDSLRGYGESAQEEPAKTVDDILNMFM